MSVDESRARVTARVWQGIAQSGVDLSAVRREDLDTVVGHIADGVMLEMNDMIEHVDLPARGVVPAADIPDAPVERVLWEGRPFLSITELYQVTTERIRVISGFLGKAHENVELVRLQDVDYNQGLSERMLNIGDVHLLSHDASRPAIVLRNVSNPEQVAETIRQAMLGARKRYGLQFREQM